MWRQVEHHVPWFDNQLDAPLAHDEPAGQKCSGAVDMLPYKYYVDPAVLKVEHCVSTPDFTGGGVGCSG